jgi:hypothetical protein
MESDERGEGPPRSKMRTDSLAVLAVALVAMLPRVSAAQETPMPGPAALSVPRPLPPTASMTGITPRDLYQQLTPPPTPTGIYSPRRHARGSFVYAPFGYTSYGVQMPAQTAPVPTIATGGLRLDASPGSAQVYVDGLYLGSVEDFGLSGRALDLDEGVHRVELRAAGYATLSFDVRIAANQTTRYRGDLEKLSPPPAVSAPAAATPVARTTYVIPNCYAGDRPPSRALPSSCDISKMIVRKP